ncbi:hypothetical protein L9F63_023854 [Diploptera punctata]|uniref:CHK kinase-like domain-containing protein n=1 Tax=Diploptera punctata TaxID=6984 RepID=A0AAD7ZHU9_DIPPU|nr:hypothetical protein L9F63_023854 [Diploptera punctata]
MVKEGKVFERESEAISKITPSVYDILRKAPGDQNSQQPFAAKCIYSQLEYPDVIIVLEDLKEQGFRMPERTEGLEMDHCLLVLRTLAKYHAATAVLYEQNPELFEPFKENMFKEKDKDKWNKFYSGTINNLVSKIKNMPNFEEHFKIQLEKIGKIAAEYVIKTFQKQDGDFNVFAHGDLWLNNIMFRYSESTGQVQDIRFVDFHPSTKLLKKHDILIEEYHKTLEETFALLDHKHLHPPIEKLRKELDKKGLFAVIIACTLLPLVMIDRSDIPDIAKVVKNEEGVKYSKKYLETLEKMVPIFEEKGWLDVEKFLKE